MATISNAIGNSSDVVSHESLQYIAAIIKAASDSVFGMIALVCLVIGFIFYVVGVRVLDSNYILFLPTCLHSPSWA